MVKLHDDILAKFPPGVLPDAKYMTQRSNEEIDLLLKGPDRGGRHLYTVAWPS
jgi:3-dehydro-scyllo-inosose hydrolase